MSDLNSEVIKIIKKLRVEKGLSQEKLSELSGLDSKYINKLENGRFNLTLPTLERILGGLEVSRSTFFSQVEREGTTPEDNLINQINKMNNFEKEEILSKITELLQVLEQ